MERFGPNPLSLGWLKALTKNGLRIDEGAVSYLTANELGKEGKFCATVSHMGEPLSAEEVDVVYGNMGLSQDGANGNPSYGWAASVKLHFLKKDLIRGYLGYNSKNELAFKFAQWSNREDDDSVLSEQYAARQNIYMLSDCFMSAKDDNLRTMEEDVKNLTMQGITFYTIVLEDGHETRGERVQIKTDPTLPSFADFLKTGGK